MLALCLIGLVLITAVNLWGIAESARALIVPMVVPRSDLRSHRRRSAARTSGRGRRRRVTVLITEALGAIATLKAFAAGCSALTGIEAIANGVPAFRQNTCQTRSTLRVDARRPARRDADRTVSTDHA
jgi:hypothetical protein